MFAVLLVLIAALEFVAVFAFVTTFASVAIVLASAASFVLTFKLVIVSACDEVLVFVFVSVAGAVVSFAVPPVEFKTETFPVIAGIASSNAVSIKQTAAPMVILDKTDCVPRGPNAVLEILLVKSAPASALPGCSKIVATRTIQEIKNNIYNKVTNIFLFVINDLSETVCFEARSAD